MRAMTVGAAAILLAACSTDGVTERQGGSPEQCVAAFERFDFAKQTSSTPLGRSDDVTIRPDLQPRIAAIRQYKCLTRSGDVSFAGNPIAISNSGAAITPATIHVGVLTDMATDAAAQAFFEARGVRTLSVGEPGLGRRFYIGAFTTSGARNDAIALAREAGFKAPYVITYGPTMRP